MIQDPSNRYIEAILASYDLNGKDVLEIGCGGGRITMLPDFRQKAGNSISDPRRM